MLRCTVEMVPGGDESRKYAVGVVELANVGGDDRLGSYVVVMTKCRPFKGALRDAWRQKRIRLGHEDEQILVAGVEGFHRTSRGVYDLLYIALRAGGLAERNPA